MSSSAEPQSNTMEQINARLEKLGLVLPPAGAPKANYQLLHRDGDLLYLSGHLPMKTDGTFVIGACDLKILKADLPSASPSR